MVCPMSWVDVPIGGNGRSDREEGQSHSSSRSFKSSYCSLACSALACFRIGKLVNEEESAQTALFEFDFEQQGALDSMPHQPHALHLGKRFGSCGRSSSDRISSSEQKGARS